MAKIYHIVNGQTQTEIMSYEEEGAIVRLFFFDGAGLQVTPTGAAPQVFRENGLLWRPVNKFSANEWAFNGPCKQVQISLAGVTGYTTYRAEVWRANEPIDLTPDGVFSGLRATTFQGYTEANVKNGVQYEVSNNVAALANAANLDTIFITGANPVLIKSRLVKFNGTSLLTRVYRAPTYTGGTPVAYFNLNDRNPVAGGVSILGGANVTAPGTEFGAPTYDIGSEGQGNSSLSTYSTFGVERLLRPNTTYLQRITNDSGAAQRVTGFLTWYEGGTDLPL